MRRNFKHLNYPFSALLIVLGLAAGCGRSKETKNSASQPPVLVTNVVTEVGESSWIVHGTNGLSVVWEDKMLSVYFAIDHTMVIHIDSATRKPTTIILETPNANGDPGHWIVDLQADGVPDTRRIKGRSGTQVFYSGEWCPSEDPKGSTRLITFEGRQITVSHDGRRWREVSTNSSSDARRN